MSSGLLVKGEDIGGGVSWSTIILGEIIFLYGATTNSYVVLSAMAVENNKTTKKDYYAKMVSGKSIAMCLDHEQYRPNWRTLLLDSQATQIYN
jgi:hypothetical protein